MKKITSFKAHDCDVCSVNIHPTQSYVLSACPTGIKLWDWDQGWFGWKCMSGSYSAASAYRLQFMGSTDSPRVTSIWEAWAPAKHRLLAWLIVQNCVLTADRLMARQWPNSYFCPLCRRNLETAEHLLIECPWSRSLWSEVASRLGLSSLRPESWRSLGSLPAWLASLAAAVPADVKTCKSIALMVIWAIWRERNDRIFRTHERTPVVVLRDIIDESSCWAMAGCRHLRARE